MDHNLVFGYDYSNKKRRQRRTDVAQLRAIFMATQTHWSNTERITDSACPGLLRTPEATATGRCHWVTTRYSLRIAPAAARATSTVNKIMMQNIPTFLAVLKSVAVRRYYTVRIAWWRRSRAFIKPLNAAIERALAPIGINRTCLPLFWGYISLSICWKRAWGPNKIGVWNINLMRST